MTKTLIDKEEGQAELSEVRRAERQNRQESMEEEVKTEGFHRGKKASMELGKGQLCLCPRGANTSTCTA